MTTLGSLVFVLLAIALGGFLYFIPCIAAHSRNHRNETAIAVLNLFLGWTLVGWVIALVWAVKEDAPKQG